MQLINFVKSRIAEKKACKQLKLEIEQLIIDLVILVEKLVAKQVYSQKVYDATMSANVHRLCECKKLSDLENLKSELLNKISIQRDKLTIV